MIFIKNIYKKYRSKKYVLRNINLNFPDKGLVTILGTSGSGKTTLLNLIGGLDKPTKGEIYIDRININKLIKDNTLYTNYISFIFQNYNLIDNLSVNDNVDMFNDKNNDTLLKKLSILNKKNNNINELSGGQQQRVAIARAIAKNTKIILCDEPTGALDHETSHSIMKLLKNISKEKLVIVITHNEELSKLYSDRVIHIKDGVIESDSSPHLITEKKSNYKKVKIKYSIKKIMNVVNKNIKRNKKRNILLAIALSIGLISLLLVTSISYGFKESIEREEKLSLAEYPIYISKTSKDLTNELSNIFKDKDKISDTIYTIDNSSENKIDEPLINYIDKLDSKYILKKYLLDNKYISYINKFNPSETILLYGNYPKYEDEVLLVINSNNEIDEYHLESINLNKNQYEFESLINHEFNIDNYKYKITGIISYKESSPLYDETGILIFKLPSKIPNDIYIYPKNYNNKQIILDKLNKYKNLSYTDYADTVKEVTTKTMDAISLILIIFSIITLLVSGIMLYMITHITILERFKEIGIYKSNGIPNLIIKLIIYLENLAVTLITLFISIIFISIMSIGINKILLNLIGLKGIMKLSLNNIVYVFILTIFITTISTFLPIKKINKLSIIETLKYNN